jgi:ribulose-5-phosphate 4-epimerase/fuculose-1-phosphate aldolase
MNEREELASTGARLSAAGYSPGTSGNLSVRVGEAILVTPSGARLGDLDSDGLSVVGLDGRHLEGPNPTKEAQFHVAIYRRRPDVGAVVHLHSTYATAFSCLAGLDPDDALPAYTPYSVMKVGQLRLLPYFRPGATGLATAIGEACEFGLSWLLANHGIVTAGVDLDAASAAAEEIEETARLHFLLRGSPTILLGTDKIAALLG